MAQTYITDTETCDGVHPETGDPCVLGDRHVGQHRTADGQLWLDD